VSSRPGVKRGEGNDSAVAVVADTWWHAKTALASPCPSSGTKGEAPPNPRQHRRTLQEGSTRQCVRAPHEGDALKAIAASAKKNRSSLFDASWPRLHGPMNCTARISADAPKCGCHPKRLKPRTPRSPKESGLPPAQCEVYSSTSAPASAARRHQDYHRQAVAIAKAISGIPVKLIWSREEESSTISTGRFRRPAVRRHRMPTATSPRCTRAWRPVDQRLLQSHVMKDGKDERQLQGYYEKPGDAQLG